MHVHGHPQVHSGHRLERAQSLAALEAAPEEGPSALLTMGPEHAVCPSPHPCLTLPSVLHAPVSLFSSSCAAHPV
jgi:hypothetical protein